MVVNGEKWRERYDNEEGNINIKARNTIILTILG